MSVEVRPKRDIPIEERTESGRFGLLFEHNPLPMWVYDLETLKFLAVNDAAVAAYGYTQAEFLRMAIPDLGPREDAARSTKQPKKKRPALQHLEKWQHRYKDGTLVDVETSSHTIPYQGHNAALVVVQNVAEHAGAEERRQESEGQYRNIYENATIGMYRITPRGKILMSNPAFVRMLGYASFEELAERDLAKAGFESGHERAEFRRQLEEAGEVKGLETAWKKKNGSTVFVRESARGIRGGNGKVLHYEGTVEGITDRKQAEILQEAIYQITQAADRTKSLSELYPEIHHIISTVLPANNFYIALYEPVRHNCKFPYR